MGRDRGSPTAHRRAACPRQGALWGARPYLRRSGDVAAKEASWGVLLQTRWKSRGLTSGLAGFVCGMWGVENAPRSSEFSTVLFRLPPRVVPESTGGDDCFANWLPFTPRMAD